MEYMVADDVVGNDVVGNVDCRCDNVADVDDDIVVGNVDCSCVNVTMNMLPPSGGTVVIPVKSAFGTVVNWRMVFVRVNESICVEGDALFLNAVIKGVGRTALQLTTVATNTTTTTTTMNNNK